jgi:deoxycytidine triphosphate deaminase
MILCDHQIEKAIRDEVITVRPTPSAAQYDSSALNLRVGDDFRIWKPSLRAPATTHSVDLDNIDLADLIELTDPLEAINGIVTILPGTFVLVRTLE